MNVVVKLPEKCILLAELCVCAFFLLFPGILFLGFGSTGGGKVWPSYSLSSRKQNMYVRHGVFLRRMHLWFMLLTVLHLNPGFADMIVELKGFEDLIPSILVKLCSCS